MKIVLTGGGTAGHVIPNIALIPPLKKRAYEIHYLGSHDGLERDLLEKEDVFYHAIASGKLRRYLDLKNITDVFRISTGTIQSLALLKKIKPKLVFSKGGYVSCPVVWAAWLCRIPVIIHESDLTPGLANKLSLPFAKKICYTFPETSAYLAKEKSVLTGLPIRQSLFNGAREKGLSLCGFTYDKPNILVVGGSLGSRVINEKVKEKLTEFLKDFNVAHICGQGNIDKNLQQKGYAQFDFVTEELADLLAMADLVISRAGATMLYEILALRKPNLLIPLSKEVSRGDQIDNAASFQRQGFSQVLKEEELAQEDLVVLSKELYRKRNDFILAMKNNQAYKATEKVLDLIDQLIP